MLARLLGCVGCVAQRQLVHLEVTVIKELKKQRHEEQEKKTPRKRAANHKKVSLVSPTIPLLIFLWYQHFQILKLQNIVIGTEHGDRGRADVNWSHS